MKLFSDFVKLTEIKIKIKISLVLVFVILVKFHQNLPYEAFMNVFLEMLMSIRL